MCGRIRDHQGREPVSVRRGVGTQIVHVDVTGLVTLHDDYPHAGHDRARWIRPVGGAGDQANVAV
jgi:hypothetical protein